MAAKPIVRKTIREAEDPRNTADPGVPQTKSLFQQFREVARTSKDRFIIQPVVRAAEAIFSGPAASNINTNEAKTQQIRGRAGLLGAFAVRRAEQKVRQATLTDTGGIIPGGAIDASGRLPRTDSSIFQIEPRGDLAEFISDNALNDYVNLQYHLVLSMMPDRDLVKLQEQIPQAIDGDNTDILQLNRRIGAVTIASTGDVFQNVSTIENRNEGRIFANVEDAVLANRNADLTLGANVERDISNRHYYNIKSLTLENIFSPSKNNSGQSQMILGKISLIEPHGFRLVEDLRRLADRIGYNGINLGRVVYRLDIFFSGYNTESGEWIPKISLDPRRSSQQDILSFFINITTMDAKVEAKGTNYELGLTPVGHTSFRPEEIVLEAQNIATGSKKANEGTQTFGGFLDNFEIALSKSRRTRSNSQIQRIYRFWAPDILRQQAFYTQEFLDEKGLLSALPNGERVIHIGKDMTITDILQAALEDLSFVRDSFLADRNNDTFLVPKILWTVRYNTIYENKNPSLNDYDNIRLEYIIEPYVSYKKATIENREQAARIVDPESQVNRVEAMVRLGMITRVYDYIHTSENTEVKDLSLNFKVLYYTAMNTSKDTTTGGGLTVSDSAATIANRRKVKNELNRPANLTDDSLLQQITNNDDPRVDSALERLFGRNRDDAVGDGQSDSDNPWNTLTGGMGELPKDDYGSANAGADDPRRQKYKIYFKDFTENDLILLNDLEIRGDPVWLLSPYANIALNTLTSFDASRGDQKEELRTNLLQPHASKVIFLKMFEPTQDDFMNPERPPVGFGRNVFGGFYEIYKVQSTFEGGKFMQKLSGSKIDHLNYVEQQFHSRSETSQNLAPGRTTGEET